ncbi:MAG: DUF885 domain-containing protein, partial [Candidatus Eremiobacteraeota bacterium]|nr:DUF885 domain-containing protein [Candidatus Eremiobacteraeota bacterium]
MTDFAAAAESILRARLKDDPIRATWTGLHDYDAELPDVTPEGLARSQTALQAHIATLETFTPGDLTPAERVDHQLLKSELDVELRELTERRPYAHDPTLYPSLAADAAYSILAREFAPLTARVPSVVARMAKIPAMLETGMRNLERSPNIWTEIAIDETQGTIEFFGETVRPLLGDDARGLAACTSVLDALAQYERFLKETHAQRDGTPFAVGRAYFDYKLTHEHLLPYTSQSLLEFGEEAVRHTELRLREVAEVIDCDATWPELVERLRAASLPEGDLLGHYRRGLDKAREFVVSRGLVTVPEGEVLEIVETPSFQRPTIPYAAYMAPGPFDARQQGLYYVTPIDSSASAQAQREQLVGHNLFGMLLTNVHEGYPGHHLQLVVANEKAPSLVRRLHDSSVFCEGWALYCEQLVLDEGLDPDPRTRLFQLKDQLWRACRVVIDVKLQTGGMTFDEAVAMLVDVAKLERVNAVGEVRRYTLSPTQPMSYLVGKEQILDLREREKTRLGSSFDLRAFHDRLLSQGSLPVAAIERSLAAGA